MKTSKKWAIHIACYVIAANALVRIQEREAAGELITGPKKIGCYGASYLYPVFLQLGIIHLPPDRQLNFYSL